MSLIGEAKLAVLLALRDEPSHGYKLATETDISSGYIYTVLRELREEDLVAISEREEEGRNRTTYELTERGELLLQALDK